MPWGQAPSRGTLDTDAAEQSGGDWSSFLRLANPKRRSEIIAARAKHYYAIIADAAAKLENKDKQARAALYAEARTILADKLRGQGGSEARWEWKALEKAISDFEAKRDSEDRAKQKDEQLFRPSSTISLVASIFIFPLFWIMDATSMSLLWVARLRKPSK